MAVLAPPFILCPLPDSKEFLGVSGDQQDSKIILTIGKNIAIRYHVPEQKQEVSWASSRHWLTSRVVYCSDIQKYAAAIDHSTVGVWDEHDGHLANMKKYKYSDPIFEVRPTRRLGTLVLFKNGLILPLSQNRAQVGPLSSTLQINETVEKIINMELEEKSNHVFIICGSVSPRKTSSKCGTEKLRRFKVLTVKLEAGDLSVLEPSGMSLARELIHTLEVSSSEGDTILGTCVIPCGEDSFVVYFSADGCLYRRRLFSNSSDEVINSLVDGKDSARIARLSCVSTSSPVVIKSLDSSTIVMFGSDASDEGAVVFIYDITYDLILSKQSLKLYSLPPIMEKIGLNVFVPVGLHILVLGLRINKSLLSSVLGRHQLRSVEFFEHRDPWVKAWGNEDHTNGDVDSEELTGYSGIEDLVKLVKTLENHGQPQSVVCGQVIPQIVENRNFAALCWSLDYFSDIPEPLIITILTLLLSSIEETENMSNATGDETPSPTTYPSNPQINQILRHPFEQRQMIRSLRGMNFETVKKLLEYLYYRLVSSWELDLSDAEEYSGHISNLMKWICTIFDAHYPQFVFNNEIGIVESLIKLMDEKSKLMNEIEGLEPLLISTISKVSFQPTPSPHSKFRSETVIFE